MGRTSIILLTIFLAALAFVTNASATEKDHRGHSGIYLGENNISAIKGRFATLNYEKRATGWIGARLALVDFQAGVFIQLGQITNPIGDSPEPRFYIAWGSEIDHGFVFIDSIKHQAMPVGSEHTYSIELEPLPNGQASVIATIDGKRVQLPELIMPFQKASAEVFVETAEQPGLKFDLWFSELKVKQNDSLFWQNALQKNQKIFALREAGIQLSQLNLLQQGFHISGAFEESQKGWMCTWVPLHQPEQNPKQIGLPTGMRCPTQAKNYS